MNDIQRQVIGKIEAQQKGIESTAPWMVGEQLKEICRNEPGSAELLDKDLDVPSMSIKNAEKQIKAWADKQKRNGNCVCVPPNTAEEILRKFYGLPERGRAAAPKQETGESYMRLEDFL